MAHRWIVDLVEGDPFIRARAAEALIESEVVLLPMLKVSQ